MSMQNKMIPFSPPDISEEEIKEVADALRSGWITTGPRTKQLEKEVASYVGADRAVCLNSQTACAEMALRILGIGEGDEVIVPAYTYTASASAVIHCGAKVVFVDIQKDGDIKSGMPEYDYEKLEAAITENTKAIMVVDLGGIVGDYSKVYEIVAKKQKLFKAKNSDCTPLDVLATKIQRSLGRVAVVADCAHSLGASRNIDGKKVYAGNIADFSSFSFHAVKNFTTGEGGAATWHLPTSVYESGVTDSEIYHMYQLLSLHGQSKDALAKTKIGSWEYDIIGPWYKCNMTDIAAAIGLRQLDRYYELLNRRNAIIAKYDEVCDELGLLHLNHHTVDGDSSNHLYLIRLPEIGEQERNNYIIKLAEMGIATNVHYKPLPLMTAYRALGFDISNYPNAYDYYKNEITLPLHTRLDEDDVEYICYCLKMVFSKNK